MRTDKSAHAPALSDLELVKIAQDAYLAGPISGTLDEKWLRVVRAVRAAIEKAKGET